MPARFVRYLFQSVFIVLVVGWSGGCVTQPKIDWAPRVGAYTYDQAVIELGPPDKMATLSDESIVAEWLTRRGRYYGSSAGYGAYYGRPYGWYGPYPSYYAAPNYVDKSPDTFVRLVFDPEGVLASFTEFRR